MIKLDERRDVSSTELETLLEQREAGEIEFVLVDVREQMEYDHQHLKGVDILHPTSTFSLWGEEFFNQNQEKTVIFTCRTGSRSANVQRVFEQNGMKSVINHQGGISTYRGVTQQG